MKNCTMQIRVNQNDKEQAAAIARELGTDLSTVVNMLLKQMIIRNTIPFSIKGNNDNNKGGCYYEDDGRTI